MSSKTLLLVLSLNSTVYLNGHYICASGIVLNVCPFKFDLSFVEAAILAKNEGGHYFR